MIKQVRLLFLNIMTLLNVYEIQTDQTQNP